MQDDIGGEGLSRPALLGAAAASGVLLPAAARAAATASMRDMVLNVPGATLIGMTTRGLTGPVITPTFPGKDVAAIRARLWTDGKIMVAGSKADDQPTIRFSPHIYNSPDEIAMIGDMLKRA